METQTFVILSFAALFGFYMAWNIGANDVANAMGTSVGSKALTLTAAIVIAGVFEFAGAFLAGSHVTDTVRKGIIDVHVFESLPNGANILMYGMLAAPLGAGVWLQLATYFGKPVSTTHSIVGAIVGFGIAAAGTSSVEWGTIWQIVISWFASPLMSGTIAALVFLTIQRAMINAVDPIRSTKRWSPVYIFLVIGILTLVTLFKGLKHLHLDLTFGRALFFAGIAGLIGSTVGSLFIKRMRSPVDAADAHPGKRPEFQFVEKVFAYLQILSACFVAFAHGANDVANAVGPVSAVVSLAKGGTEALSGKAPVPLWVLLLGGIGIVLGLATWGWRVMKTIGEKITELTPTRGFSAEFAAATTIVIASRMGIPISTTHTLVGGVMGVGIARGIASMNPRELRDIFISWVLELPVAAGLSAMFFYVIKAAFETFGS